MPNPLAGDKAPRAELFIVLVLAGVQFSHLMDFIMMMPLAPQLMRVFGINAREFGLVVSVYTFSAAISCFCAALFMDRFDRKTVLMTVYSGLVLGTVACGFAPNFHLLLGARVITGVFGGLLQAVIFAILGDVVAESRRGRATGIVMAAFAVTSVAGVPVGLIIANRWGWNATFLSLGGLSFANLLLAWRVIPPVREHLKLAAAQAAAGQRRAGPLSAISGLLRERNTWVAILIIITMMSIFAIMPFISPFLVSIVGIGEGELPTVYLWGGLASLIVSPLIGRLSDKYGARRVFIISSFFSIPAVIAFASLGHATLAWATVLNTVLSAVGAGRMTPSMDLINSSVDQQRRGSFMTLISSVQQLSASAASLGGGMILGEGTAGLHRFGILGWIVAGTMIASSLLSLLLRPVAAKGGSDFTTAPGGQTVHA